ncbi:hypothetical protein BH10BAC1_BH10BAC1_12600 [soil metagenome]
MKKIILYLLIATIGTLSFSSCKKYPDGPGMSLLSRKARLSNVWHLSNYYENGVDKTSDFQNVFQNAVLTIEKEGSYSLKYRAFGITDYNETGTWRFINDDASFETNPSSGTGSVGQHYILRLKNKELWYQDTDANGLLREYHLIP